MAAFDFPTSPSVNDTYTLNTKTYMWNGESWLNVTLDERTMILGISDETTSLTTGVGKITFRTPHAMTLTRIPRATLTTVSTSGAVTVDINEAGVSILGSGKLTIDQSEKSSTTAATPTTLADTSLADDAEISIDVDGAGVGAAGLKVLLFYVR